MTNKETGNDVDPTEGSVDNPSDVLMAFPLSQPESPFIVQWKAMQAAHKAEQEWLAEPDDQTPLHELMRRCGRL